MKSVLEYIKDEIHVGDAWEFKGDVYTVQVIGIDYIGYRNNENGMYGQISKSSFMTLLRKVIVT